MVLGRGIPALRHDWLFPIDTNAFVQRMLDLGMGWTANGMGGAYPYPMTYFVMLPLIIVARILGAVAATTTLITGAALILQFAGAAIAKKFGNSPYLGPVIATFLAFNPWTYNKIVAGHVTQIAAYGGLCLVIANLSDANPRRRPLAIGTIISALQTQFLFIALLLCLFRARLPVVRYAIVAGFLVYLPSFAGILLERSTLAQWPYTIAWENQQSVPLRTSWLLQGYFTHYASSAFGAFGWIGTAIIAIAGACVVLARREPRLVKIALLVVATLVFVSGTEGPIGGAWRWAILNVPAISVFREMYDVLGFVAILYAIVAARLTAVFPKSFWLVAGASLMLPIAWLITPPYLEWVPAQTLPPRDARVNATLRYALMPPFQPLSYHGKGAGADPLYIGTSPENAPINSLLPTFPANAALAKYAMTGNASPLSRLGVSLVVCRDFTESAGERTFYGPMRQSRGICRTRETPLPHAVPIASLEPSVNVCSLCSLAGRGNVFFGDLPGETFVHAPGGHVCADPNECWIDARLVFPSHPNLAQGLGGVYTTQTDIPITLPARLRPLVAVQGSLLERGGRPIAAGNGSYQWLAASPKARTVFCLGACLIAGYSPRPFGPLEAPAPRWTRVPLHMLTAWLADVSIPAGAGGVLRFLEMYDSGWIALNPRGMMLFPHIRLDASLNGWQIPASPQTEDLILVQVKALVEFLAEIGGFCTILVVCLSKPLAEDTRNHS
jgi:hypothetical protein